MIPIFIGYDKRVRVAANVLIDSIYNHSSEPVSVTPLVIEQLRFQNYIGEIETQIKVLISLFQDF